MNPARAHERIDALATRIDALETWMEAFKLQMTDVGNEVRANTRLTEETHGTAQEMYDFLAPAVWFFQTLGAIGRGIARAGRACMSVLEVVGRLAKPIFWIAAIVAATWAWWKTGAWTMPEWWGWFAR